jgi:hypothetical protein
MRARAAQKVVATATVEIPSPSTLGPPTAEPAFSHQCAAAAAVRVRVRVRGGSNGTRRSTKTTPTKKVGMIKMHEHIQARDG